MKHLTFSLLITMAVGCDVTRREAPKGYPEPQPYTNFKNNGPMKLPITSLVLWPVGLSESEEVRVKGEVMAASREYDKLLNDYRALGLDAQQLRAEKETKCSDSSSAECQQIEKRISELPKCNDEFKDTINKALGPISQSVVDAVGDENKSKLLADYSPTSVLTIPPPTGSNPVVACDVTIASGTQNGAAYSTSQDQCGKEGPLSKTIECTYDHSTNLLTLRIAEANWSQKKSCLNPTNCSAVEKANNPSACNKAGGKWMYQGELTGTIYDITLERSSFLSEYSRFSGSMKVQYADGAKRVGVAKLDEPTSGHICELFGH